MIKKKTLANLSRKNRVIFLGVLSICAGIVNGFLGTGGGIVLMFALSLIPSSNESSTRDRFATVIAVILPLSLISAITYGKNVDLNTASPYILPGIFGGIIGALLLDKLSVKIVKRLFAAMVIWAGISFLR